MESSASTRTSAQQRAPTRLALELPAAPAVMASNATVATTTILKPRCIIN